jgi:hypothetical protein
MSSIFNYVLFLSSDICFKDSVEKIFPKFHLGGSYNFVSSILELSGKGRVLQKTPELIIVDADYLVNKEELHGLREFIPFKKSVVVGVSETGEHDFILNEIFSAGIFERPKTEEEFNYLFFSIVSYWKWNVKPTVK